MLKYIVLFAVLPGAAPIVPCQPNQTAHEDQAHGDSKGKSEPACQHDCGTAKNANDSKSDPPKWYTAFKRPDGWLVVLGFATLVVVGYQTIQTRKAADAAASSAEAALLNARAVINAERAWLTVSVRESPRHDKGFYILVRNRGHTPARVISIDSNLITFVTDPNRLVIPPDYECRVSLPDSPFVVNGFSLRNGCYPEELFKQRRASRNWEYIEEALMIYGRIIYVDVFPGVGDGPHETCWCYVYDSGFKKFRTGGPDKYTRNT